MSRLLHQLSSDDPQLHFSILRTVRVHLERGGPRRMRHTFPALAFCGLEVRAFVPGFLHEGRKGGMLGLWKLQLWRFGELGRAG